MENDFFAQRRAPANGKWRLWNGAILPCHCKLLVRGEPRLVGLYFRTQSVTRCVVRLEWRDGSHWVREGVDAPWHVHELGEQSSRDWADMMCEKVALEWSCDELKRELDKKAAA